jgi:hypothetical protein
MPVGRWRRGWSVRPRRVTDFESADARSQTEEEEDGTRFLPQGRASAGQPRPWGRKPSGTGHLCRAAPPVSPGGGTHIGALKTFCDKMVSTDQAFALTGDAYAMDPVCQWSPKHYLIEKAVQDANCNPIIQSSPIIYRRYQLDRPASKKT